LSSTSILVLAFILCLPLVHPATFDDLECTANDYSQNYWRNNYPTRTQVSGTWVGRGVFYTVDPNTLVFTTLSYTDATLFQFYDPMQGASITQFWIRFVSPANPTGQGQGVGIPSGNFTTYVDRFQTPHKACLVANNTAQFEAYYSDATFYSTTIETNTHFNKTTGRVAVHEVFRYPIDYNPTITKMITTYQMYDDTSNSLVIWNGYNLCKVSDSVTAFSPTSTTQWPTVCGVINPPPSSKKRYTDEKMVRIGRGLVPEKDLPKHLKSYATPLEEF